MLEYFLNNKKQNIFNIESRHDVKIIFNIDNNLTISEYKLANNGDGKTTDLKLENQQQDRISKKRRGQKQSLDNSGFIAETNTELDEKKNPSIQEHN